MNMTTLGAIALEWSVTNYYILSGLVLTLVIFFGLQLMQTEPDNNKFMGALIAGSLTAAAGYFLRDADVLGALILGFGMFIVLAAVTSGEVLRSFIMTFVMIALWGGFGMVLLPQTPLDEYDVGGFTQIVMQGGLEERPITEDDTDELLDPDSYISE